MNKFISTLLVSFLLAASNVEGFASVKANGRAVDVQSQPQDFGLSMSNDINQEDSAIISRRNALKSVAKLSFAAATVVAAAPNAALADIYDDQEKARKAKAAESAEGAKTLVPAVLLGGTLLSVPFFLPNLLRLGSKLSSGGDDDGYGK